MKEFNASVRARANAERKKLADLTFRLDGESYTMRAPKEAQLAFLVATHSSSRNDSDRIAALLDFLEQAVEQPGNSRLRARLLDRDDELEFDTVADIIEWACGEWSGRPPTSASASS